MDKLTLGQCRETIARVMNVCEASDVIPGYVNEAERRLVAKGKWAGTTQRYRICTSSTGCLTWPRAIDTIESFWICNTPGLVRNGWYEASFQGPGNLTSETSYWNTLVDRGTMPTFDVIEGTQSKVAVRSDVTEVGKRILLRGYDHLGEWIRTQDAGVWIDGEYVAISTTTQYTTKLFSSITGVIKDSTNGPVRMWQYNATTGTLVKQLAFYEASEVTPIYRASLIPGLSYKRGCSQTGCTPCSDSTVQLTVIAKLRHIDVVNDNDFLLLGNLGAIKLMVQSILKEERNLFEESMAYEQKAIRELQAELLNYEGDGALPTIRQEGRESWGGGVLNSVTLGWPLTY